MPAKTGRSYVVGALAPCSSTEPRPAYATSCGTAARAEISRALPAYTPPSSGSTSRSVTSGPNRRSTRAPTETSPTRRSGGSLVSRRTRANPSGESTPDAASWSRSSGTPINERGKGRSSPRVQIRDDAPVGCSIGSPSSRASATPSGRRLSIASAPTSTVTPATDARSSLPPVRGVDSRTRTSCPPATRSRAAVRPATPAPTTTTLPMHPLCQQPGRSGGSAGDATEPAAVEDQRLRGVGVLDGVQLEQHDRVIARLDLAVDRAVEHREAVGERDRPVGGGRHDEVVEAVLDGTGQLPADVAVVVGQ